LLDAANSAAAPASRDEAYEYAAAQDTVTSHMTDLPARHGISVNHGRFPSERLRPNGSLETGTPATPAEARDLAMTSLRWWCLTVLPGAVELAYIQDCVSQKSRLVFHSGTGEEHSFTASRVIIISNLLLLKWQHVTFGASEGPWENQTSEMCR